jgi:nitroimidazol reductase NimA-like FMN-containing flavoprotein (pyridoxamine 5'-phosphate oxidase superfamily)
MPINDHHIIISRILNQQIQLVLATLNISELCQHLMAYGFSEDLTIIYLASYSDTRKVRNMRATPPVSLLWDNRTGHISDHNEGYCLTAQGEAKELLKDEATVAKRCLHARSPNTEAMLKNKSVVFFSINVNQYVLARGSAEVQTYTPSSQ